MLLILYDLYYAFFIWPFLGSSGTRSQDPAHTVVELHPRPFILLLSEISLAGCLSVCRDRVSLCNPDLSGTRDIDQTLRDLPASASRCGWITGVSQHISMTGLRSFDVHWGMNEVQQLERGRAKVWSASLCCRKKLPELVLDPLLWEVLTTPEKEGMAQTLTRGPR